jgi:beta-galactosidase
MPDIRFPFVLHGGDYNPEQFPEAVWEEDLDLMKQASINIATLPVFGWGNLQPNEETWTFDWLDKVIDKLHGAGIKLCLATATAATPPWVDQKYPDILRVDREGRKVKHGGRHTFCPSSKNFRRLATTLARKMAERYGHHPAVAVWHISNEYGNSCFCENCAQAFRAWLKAKYGTLEEVNFRWNTAFWGQTYTDWSQIEAPVLLGQTTFQGQLIDYDRFQSESILDSFRAERDVVRAISPNVPITTNLMGTFKPLDYHAWAKEMDIVSWDCYPPRSSAPDWIAFRHALTRGLKDGQSWMLMEQTPSQQNWQRYNSLKRPGVMRLWSYQAMAHGADSVLYFQWRRSPGAAEMFHGAVVEHAGSSEARVFQEVAELGSELEALGSETIGGRVQADVALLFDWENWWAVEYSIGPSVDLKYLPQALAPYKALFDLGVTVDVVSPDSNLSKYKLVVAPVLKMVKPGLAEKIESLVRAGGSFVATFFSGIVDATDRAFPNGYPGPLSDVLGIWVEETDALAPEEKNAAVFGGEDGQVFECGLLCDRIRLRGAEAMARYSEDFYGGEPVVTKNAFGEGSAYYIGSALEEAGLSYLFTEIIRAAKVQPVDLGPATKGVEVVSRGGLYYVLNHNKTEQTIVLRDGIFGDLVSKAVFEGEITLPAYGVAILRPQ